MLPNWLVGVILATLASFISNLGLNLQKLNHTQNEHRIRQQLRQAKKGAAAAAAAAATPQTNVPAALYSGVGVSNLQQGPAHIPPPLGIAGSRVLDDDRSTAAAAQSHSLQLDTTTPGTSFYQSGDWAPSTLSTTNTSSLAPPLTTSTHSPATAYEHLQLIDYTKQGLWRAGLLLVTLGSLLDFVALIFAAQSIVAPLGSLTLVSNTILAPVLLGESISRRDLFATGAIVAGSALAVIFADHTAVILSVPQLFECFATIRFTLYAILVITTLAALLTAERSLSKMQCENPRKYHAENFARMHRFSYASIAGIAGAQSVLFAKCIGEILVNSLQARGAFLALYWQTYVIFAMMGLTVVVQIKYLNRGLQQFDALYIVPVFQSFWILVSVVGGMVFFGEWRGVFLGEHDGGTASAMMFPAGILMTIAGVYVLSQRGATSATSCSSSKHHHRAASSTAAGDDSSLQSTPVPRNFRHFKPYRLGGANSSNQTAAASSASGDESSVSPPSGSQQQQQQHQQLLPPLHSFSSSPDENSPFIVVVDSADAVNNTGDDTAPSTETLQQQQERIHHPRAGALGLSPANRDRQQQQQQQHSLTNDQHRRQYSELSSDDEHEYDGVEEAVDSALLPPARSIPQRINRGGQQQQQQQGIITVNVLRPGDGTVDPHSEFAAEGEAVHAGDEEAAEEHNNHDDTEEEDEDEEEDQLSLVSPAPPLSSLMSAATSVFIDAPHHLSSTRRARAVRQQQQHQQQQSYSARPYYQSTAAFFQPATLQHQQQHQRQQQQQRAVESYSARSFSSSSSHAQRQVHSTPSSWQDESKLAAMAGIIGSSRSATPSVAAATATTTTAAFTSSSAPSASPPPQLQHSVATTSTLPAAAASSSHPSTAALNTLVVPSASSASSSLLPPSSPSSSGVGEIDPADFEVSPMPLLTNEAAASLHSEDAATAESAAENAAAAASGNKSATSSHKKKGKKGKGKKHQHH